MDYRSALALQRLRHAPVPDAVCFHAEQCAEKYLKAVLLLHTVPPQRTHALSALNDLLKTVLPAARSLDLDCALLQQFAVEVRYPGASATGFEAQMAIASMRRIRRFARRALGAQS